jgi:hypothetical protein
MKDGCYSATSLAAIFDDCTILAGFGEMSFKHCNREANKAAHALARHSFNDHLDCIWHDDFLAFFNF